MEMEETYKKVWRVDCENLSCKPTEVSEDAPIGQWISTWGEAYAYLETEKEAKALLKSVIQSKIDELQKQLEATK